MFSNYDDIITLDQLMEILDVGRNKAYELLQTGQIKSFKIGKSYRIPKQAIKDYVLFSIKKRES